MSVYITFGHDTGEAVRLGPFEHINFDDCSIWADGRPSSIAEWSWTESPDGTTEEGWTLNHPNEDMTFTTTRVEAEDSHPDALYYSIKYREALEEIAQAIYDGNGMPKPLSFQTQQTIARIASEAVASEGTES